MYLDASAIVAILMEEADAPTLLARLEAAETPRYVSPATLYEAVTAVARIAAKRNNGQVTAEMIAQAETAVAAFIATLGAVEISISPEIGRAALEAAKRYGKSVGHPAQLNFGDCFAYACAKQRGVPLLYKGDDFSETDLA